jgi:hypothetical protein
METIKKLILNQCEKLVRKIIEDQSTAYSPFNFACKSLACAYRWSKYSIHKCHKKFGRVSNYCNANRSQKTIDKRRKTLGNLNIIVFVCGIHF